MGREDSHINCGGQLFWYSSVEFSKQVLAAGANRLAALRADGLEWSDLGDPRRVLSVITHKRIHVDWNFEQVVEAIDPRPTPS